MNTSGSLVGKKSRRGRGSARAAKVKRSTRKLTTARNGKAAKREKTRRAVTLAHRTARRGATDAVEKVFARLGRRQGCGAMILVVERAGNEWDHSTNICEIETSVIGSKKRGAGLGRSARLAAGMARALAAVGHVQRVKIMGKLLEGPATYRTLQRVSRLKPGPLYHHINQLRLAGLILPKQRDLYELTRGGRNLILAALAAAPLIRDARRRPQDRGE